MKFLSKQSLILIALAVTVVLAVGVLAVQKKADIPVPVVENEEEQDNQGENEENIAETVDTSDWQTYRNEEYGFEFKLPDEYLISENSHLIKITEENSFLITPNLKEYRFSSRTGIVAINEAKRQDIPITDALMDTSAIQLKVYPNIDIQLFHNNFEEWLMQNAKTSFARSGQVMLSSGFVVNYAIWNSICENTSAFFGNDEYILEVNTCASTFLIDGKNDYFSTIVDSVSFLQ